jgi:hypothetical protein
MLKRPTVKNIAFCVTVQLLWLVGKYISEENTVCVFMVKDLIQLSVFTAVKV